MARKRMITKDIFLTDSFLRLPHSAMSLYTMLCLLADDDGFYTAPVDLMGRIRATENDMKLLFENNLILVSDGGVIVVKHWLFHNCLVKGKYRYTPLPLKKEIGFEDDGTYMFLKDMKVGEKSLSELIEFNESESIPRTKVKEAKDKLIKSVQTSLDTSVGTLGESRKEKKIEEREESITKKEVETIKTSGDNFYGAEHNVLLTPIELEQIQRKFEESNKLINKISYMLLNYPVKRSHYGFLMKIALEDNWPLKKVVRVSNKEKVVEETEKSKRVKEKMVENNMNYDEAEKEVSEEIEIETAVAKEEALQKIEKLRNKLEKENYK